MHENLNDAVEHRDIEEEKDLITFEFRTSYFYAIIIITAYVLGLASGYVLRGQENATLVEAFIDSIPTVVVSEKQAIPSDGKSGQQAQNPKRQDQDTTRYDVPLDDDPRLGPADAPITIIELSDYECPYCTRFHLQTFEPLMQKYGDKIQFVYRDLPLVNIHPEAFPAAIAANCAGEQDSYWNYHNLLFKGGPQELNSTNYLNYAEQIGLDIASFQECLESGRWDEEIQADLDYALGIGVRSTPTFFINGIPVVGAQPLEVFVNVIEAELSGENQ